jgi:hypothetical protein
VVHNDFATVGVVLFDFIQAYFIVFILIGALLALRATLSSSTRAVALLTRELCLAASFYFVYYLVRGLVKDQTGAAHEHARAIVAFEGRVGLLHEAAIQRFVTDSSLLTRFVNWVYVWWFWGPIIFGLCWLFMRHYEHYETYRNALLISGGLGLLIYTLYPVAPPRFVGGIGVLDTISQRSMTSHVLLPQGLANQYAAVPSLHAGWTLLMGIAFVRHARNIALRAFGVFLPAAMYFSIVATGNHFIFDGLAGYVVVLTGLYLSLEASKRLAAYEPTVLGRPVVVHASERRPQMRA